MHIGYYEGQFWTINHILSPERFYLALPLLLDQETIIYFDSSEERDESYEFLDRHAAPTHQVESVSSPLAPCASRWTGHFLYSPELHSDFQNYFRHWNSKIADNIICYRRGTLLLWFHDAFSGGELHLAPSYSESVTGNFCSAMAPTYKLRTFDSDAAFRNIKNTHSPELDG